MPTKRTDVAKAEVEGRGDKKQRVFLKVELQLSAPLRRNLLRQLRKFVKEK